MPDPGRKRALRADAGRERSWGFTPGDTIVPGIRAWALLGDGRRCETWLAWCLERCAPVALKLPRPDRIDARSRQALAREARMAGGLAHPGVQRLLAEALDTERPHLVFEYVEGPTLESRLDECGALRPPDVARLGLQLASILHYLHGRRVVHCDVKPANVALHEGRAVLLDFDVARALGEDGAAARARGTADYMAPEQVRGGSAQPGMDLFALGATLYEAAAGTPAFEGSDDGSTVVYAQLERRPRELRALAPEVAAPLERAIYALLDPDPARRPVSALAALALLGRALPPGEPGLWPRWMTRILREEAARGPGPAAG